MNWGSGWRRFSCAARTANGLLRFSRRYEVVGVIDGRHAGRGAGEVVRGAQSNPPVFASLREALDSLGAKPDYLVVGLNTEEACELPRGFR